MWTVNSFYYKFFIVVFLFTTIFEIKLVTTFQSEFDFENGTNSNLPLLPYEDQPVSTNQILDIVTNSIQDDEKPQVHTQSQQINFTEITEFTDSDIKYEISNPPPIPIMTSRIIPPDMDDYKVLVQKCCPIGQALRLGQPGEQSICEETTEEFLIYIFYANSTNYWNYTTTLEENVNIEHKDPCENSKYFLDPLSDKNDTFHLLYNTSLYIPFNLDMLNLAQYCVDTILTSAGPLNTAIICTTEPNVPPVHIIYCIGLTISAIFLVALSFYSMKRKDISEDHKKCLAFFAGTMATAYALIAIFTYFNFLSHFYISISLTYIIYYLKLSFYIWLNIICYDTCRCVREYKTDQSFMKIYLSVAYITPSIFIIINLMAATLKPALPNLYVEYTFSSNILWNIFMYFLPVLVSSIANIIGICYIKSGLPKARYNNVKEFLENFSSKDWKKPPENIYEIKEMYRRSLALFILVTALLAMDLIIFLVPSSGEKQAHFIIRDVCYCLQGFLVSIVFVPKRWCYSTCCHSFSRKLPLNKKNKLDKNYSEVEMQPINNGTL